MTLSSTIYGYSMSILNFQIFQTLVNFVNLNLSFLCDFFDGFDGVYIKGFVEKVLVSFHNTIIQTNKCHLM